MVRRKIIALSLCLAAAPAAAVGGAWSSQSAGGVINVGKQLLVGRTLHAPAGVTSRVAITRLTWRVTLLSPPPTGLQIKLCHPNWCLPLPTLAGQIIPTTPLAASGDFRFIYSVNRPGQLQPPLNVVSNQLTISYR